MNKRVVSAGVLAAVALSMASVAPVAATDWRFIAHAATGDPKDVTGGLFSPLSLAVDGSGTSFVSQNFPGTLTRVDSNGTTSTLAQALPGEEIGAVSELGSSVYYYEGAQPQGTARLMSIPKTGGEPTQIADLAAHERSANPDQVNRYGFDELPQSCLDQIPPGGFLEPSYTGLIDTHPYASVATPQGLFVADAGGNDILRVGYDGTVSTLAVLPPSSPLELTAELAGEAGLPDCVIGLGYRFEPVPTDVELGPDGWLYITSLPGGPEDPSAGPRGAVYKVDPATGQTVLVASGVTGATGLAVSRLGVIMVTELYGGPDGAGQVSLIVPGVTAPIGSLAVGSPAAIELQNGSVYVTRDAFVPDESGMPQPIGKLTSVRLRGGSFLW